MFGKPANIKLLQTDIKEVFYNLAAVAAENIVQIGKVPHFSYKYIYIGNKQAPILELRIINSLLKMVDPHIKCVMKEITIHKSPNVEYIFQGNYTAVYVNRRNGNLTVQWLVPSLSLNLKLSEFLETYHCQIEELSNYVHILGRGSHGYTLRKLELTESNELNPDNYTKEVVEDFNYILKSLYDPKNYPGNLSILDGPPGTGKTYMIRSMVREAGAYFIIVPPDLIPHLHGPDLLSLFIDYKIKDIPIVLILEDADHALAPRMADNMSSVSAVLNMGDGIIGNILDIRIVATSNTDFKEVDKALLRPGRLCKRIHIGALSAERATKLSKKLGHKKKYVEPATLAEVYNNKSNKDVKSASFGFNK